jgi:hypothetical protein
MFELVRRGPPWLLWAIARVRFVFKRSKNVMRDHRLELHEDPSFQVTEWKVQRVGWVLWAAILMAGLLGLIGTGPLSSAEATAPDDSLTVVFQRFTRCRYPTLVHVFVWPGPANSRELRIKLSPSLLGRMDIRRIEPEPIAQTIAADGIVYMFSREDELESAKVVFHVEFERFGRSQARIELLGHEPVFFGQFVYP